MHTSKPNSMFYEIYLKKHKKLNTQMNLLDKVVLESSVSTWENFHGEGK